MASADSLGRTPALRAAVESDWAALEAALRSASSSADAVGRPDLLGRTCLHFAAASAPRALVCALLAAAPSAAAAATKSAETPLHWLCDARELEAGDEQIITALLAAGADAGLRNSAGSSAADILRRRLSGAVASSAFAVAATACLSVLDRTGSLAGAATGAGAGGGADHAAHGATAVPMRSPAAAASTAPGGGAAPKKAITIKLKK